MKRKQISKCLAQVVSLFGVAAICSTALGGTWTNDFNSLQLSPDDPDKFVAPDGTVILGNTGSGKAAGYDLSINGKTGGCIKLTTASNSQGGGFIVHNFDSGATPVGFDIRFDLFMGGGGGTPADGTTVAVGDFADAQFGEEGPGNIHGLSVCFDIYNNGGTVAEAPAIDLKWNNVIMAHKLLPIGALTLAILSPSAQPATPTWLPVIITGTPSGKVSVTVNGVVIYQDFPIYSSDRIAADIAAGTQYNPNGWQVGFGARTGNANDNQWIDNLGITTTLSDPANGQPYIVAVTPVNPIDQPVSAAGGLSFTLKDDLFSVDPATIKLLYNGAAITPAVSRIKSDPNLANPDETFIAYFGNNGVLPAGAATAQLTYYTTSTPAVSNNYTLTFTVGAFTTLPTNWVVSGADTTKPGFRARVYQMDNRRTPGDANLIINAERQLALGYINADGNPYTNYSNLNPTNGLQVVAADGWFDITNSINMNGASGNAGNFSAGSNPPKPDQPIPGFPGVKPDADGDTLPDPWLFNSNDNLAVEFIGFLDLKVGGYRFGFNSDDGFVFTIGSGNDAAARPINGSFNGGRGASDTLFDVVVAKDGVYPVRISYWQGTGGVNCELFTMDPFQVRHLVGDPDDTNSVKAYREASGSRPSIARVLPVQNDVAAYPNDDLIIDIRDGGIPVIDSSVIVRINGTDQTVTKTRTGFNNNTLSIKRPGSPTNLLPSGLNTVTLIYGFTENGNAVSLTNTYSYSVTPYYAPIQVGTKVDPANINTGDTGFNIRWTQMDRSRDGNQGNGGRITGAGDANRMPTPEIQLSGGEINPTNGLPYENVALPGPNNDFTDFRAVVNWNNGILNNAKGSPNSGMFFQGQPAQPETTGNQPETAVPGLPGAGDPATLATSNNGWDNYVAEITTYLQLKAGITVFGFNSDDGYVAISGADPHDTLGTLIGYADFGKGNSGNLANPTALNPPQIMPGVNQGGNMFTAIVPEDGIYPIRILYWEGGGGVNAEFFSMNKNNRRVFLVNDEASLDPNTGLYDPYWVRAYRTYTGPAKPWVRFSASPNQWDNRVQQAGPGPIQMFGRTRAQVQSNDIYNWMDVFSGANFAVSATLGQSGAWGDITVGATIANGAPGGTADASIGVLVDGASVPATKTVVNTSDLKVAYKPATPLSVGAHTASLIYAGTTNTWKFWVQKYVTLNAADAAAPADVDTANRGFSMKMVQTSVGQPNTAAGAEALLTNTTIAIISQTNSARSDGRYILPDIINFNNNNNNNPAASGQVQQGNFQDASYYGPLPNGWPFPGTPFYADRPVIGTASATSTANFAAEIFGYVQFPTAGFYRFGGNVDDGFVVKVGKPGVNTGQVIATMDRPGGPQDIPFGINVPQAGYYPIRFIWYQGGGGAAFELFTYDQDKNNTKHALNDPNDPASIKVFQATQAQAAPQIVGTTLSGGNIQFTWTGGGELQSASVITGPWTGTGNTTGTASIPVGTTAPSMKFFRIAR